MEEKDSINNIKESISKEIKIDEEFLLNLKSSKLFNIYKKQI